MTDIRHEIELVTPGLNLLEDHGEGAKSVIERTKKTLHQAAERIEELQDIIARIQYTNLRQDINAENRTIEIEKLCKGKPNEQR